MAVLIAPDTPYGKELWKWEHRVGEAHPSDPSIKGMSNPGPYPAMLYKAVQKNPWRFEKETVADLNEQRNLESRGFVAGGPAAAAEAFDCVMDDLARAAAHRNYEDRNMSAAAKARTDQVEQASSQHVGEIPAEPIPAHRKRGRPARVTEATRA